MNPKADQGKPRRELVRSSYQPTESELKEPISLPPGTTLDQFVTKLVEPVDILWTDKPRRSR
ncbi:MAG: hypothetical protein OXT71_22925 [Acidobacteriota bacterium]|nr:hypothetical protein [Acidobacteriota bacterium]